MLHFEADFLLHYSFNQTPTQTIVCLFIDLSREKCDCSRVTFLVFRVRELQTNPTS
jgi:hypothetical protein